MSKIQLKECTCPVWWFPPDIREKLRKFPHAYHGVLAHHKLCEKRKHQKELSNKYTPPF